MNDDAGMVRPFRRRVRHAACGTLTVISAQAAEALALDPRALPDLHCTSCQRQFPVADFWWIGDDGNEAEPVGWIPPLQLQPEAEDDVQPAAEPEQPAAVTVALADYDELAQDAADRRAALSAAVMLLGQIELIRRGELVTLADHAYHWLRSRDTLRVTSVQITPGTPRPEGAPVATVFNLGDTQVVTFSLTGFDAKGAAVPLPAGFSAAWSLADPDATGAVLTQSDDTSTADLSGGVPDSNLLVSVIVTIDNPDGSTTVLNGAEAVVVTATDAVTVGIVPGTPTAQAAPSGDGSATPSA